MKQNGIERKFIGPEEIDKLGKKWSSSAKINESVNKDVARQPRKFIYGYKVDRQEGKDGVFGIEKLQKESILEKVIPRLLKELPAGQKLKILDNGAGIGVFSDQIRAKFGDRVDVYSTGLSKQAAREYRKKESLPKLHKNDLKWRSIQELSDYPEFGLIIDTYGEAFYRTTEHIRLNEEEIGLGVDLLKEFYKHIEQIVKKLLPGGYATLYPVDFANEGERESVVKKIIDDFGVNAYYMGRETLKLEKPKITMTN
jgi:hypothetical protein